MASKRWAWVAALAVLVAGITNAHAHVHLCFDGHDPPAAVYLADGSDHDHGLDEDIACSGDIDVDLQNQVLAKTVKHDLLAIEPLIVWALAFEPDAASRTALHPASSARTAALTPQVLGPFRTSVRPLARALVSRAMVFAEESCPDSFGSGCLQRAPR
jgi:hypothetical protein